MVVHFFGHQHFRQRLVLAILSGKAVRIDKIRSEDKDPGLRGELPFFGHTRLKACRLRNQPS